VGACRLVALALIAVGCRQIAGLDDPLPGDGTGSSGPFCYGEHLVQVCFSAEPSGDLQLMGNFSGASPPCNTNVTSGGDGFCVISGATIEVASGITVTATGAPPFVLVASDSITITGTLDASSHGGGTGSQMGAGADYAGCMTGSSPSNGGGGEGGSFAMLGGSGGTNGSGSPTTAGATIDAASLHGGCPGHASSGSEIRGGHGGGAIYMIATNTISVPGVVDASGAGGSGGDDPGTGGGGGGTGGMIGLEASTVNVGGFVFANGGGGGQGGGNGQSGKESLNGAVGAGGAGSGSGGDGGDGGADSNGGAGMNAGTGTGGGGGGGGGGSVGAILIFGTESGSGVISPAAS